MMLDFALAYARHGIPVLPVHSPAPGRACSCGRAGCESPGKHPRLRHGHLEASTDEHTIERWWQRWPEANVGLRTGIAMDVADIDSREGWQALRHLLGDVLPPGPRVRTGSGGKHLWFLPSGHGNRVRLLPGLDWRGAGGYVVAPPSRHVSGGVYRWEVRPAGGYPTTPPALREMIAGPALALTSGPPREVAHPDRYAAAALEAETERVAHAVVGTRNDTLNRAAFALGRLVGAGWLDAGTVTRELTAAAAWAGLRRLETHRTIRSGLAAGLRAAPPTGGNPAKPPQTSTTKRKDTTEQTKTTERKGTTERKDTTAQKGTTAQIAATAQTGAPPDPTTTNRPTARSEPPEAAARKQATGCSQHVSKPPEAAARKRATG